MSYTVTLRETDKKKVYVDPRIREGIYLYPGEIKKLKLLEGSMLEEDEFERIRLQYALPRAKHRAIAILAKRDKTEKELRDKLQQSLTDTKTLEETISYVRTCGYVDDVQYARDYIYFKKGRKSFLQIKMELQKKGISSQVLETVFEEEGGQEMEDILMQVKKYMRRFPQLDYASRQKIYAHFARKGYNSELIREAMTKAGELLEEDSDTENFFH